MFRGSRGLCVVFHRPLGYFCPRDGFLSPAAAAWGLAHHTFGCERGEPQQEELGVIYKWNFHGKPRENGFHSERDSQGSSALHRGAALQPLGSPNVTTKCPHGSSRDGGNLEKPLLPSNVGSTTLAKKGQQFGAGNCRMHPAEWFYPGCYSWSPQEVTESSLH